jgi:hypothetical protein
MHSNRQMIAGIYYALAQRALVTEPKLGESIMRTHDKNLVRANELEARAELYLDIDRLTQPVGYRTR